MRGSNAALVRTDQRSWDSGCRSLARRDRCRAPARTAVKPGAISRLTSRPLSSVMGAPYSQRKPALMVRPGSMRQSSVKYSVVDRLAKIFVRVAEGDGAGVGNADQKVGEVRAVRRCAGACGCRAGKVETARADSAGSSRCTPACESRRRRSRCGGRDRCRPTRKARRCDCG